LAPLGIPLLPTQLFEAAGDALLFAAALALARRNPRAGTVFCFYLVSYGLFRFALEFYRGDDRGMVIAHLQPSQWIALVAVAIGVSLYVALTTRIEA
jgi:phosphatidylglycerol:prolipoprotein diacylglycerol transferase